MLTVRKRTYNTRNSYQDTFARIRIDTERVAILANPLAGNLTVETNKPWVGKINSSEGTFMLVETNSSILPFRVLEGNFFTIFVHGKVLTDEHKTIVDTKFKLGWHATLTFLCAYFFTISLTIKFISQNDWDSLKGLTPWFLVFNAIPTLLVIVQLNRLENKISDLLGSEL